MLATTSVGSTTAVCSLSDQVKKYKARSITEDHYHHLQHADSSNNKQGKPRRVLDSLVILCVKVLTAQFGTKANPMQGIPAKFLPEVTQRLPMDLPLTATAPHIHDENFWKRCCLHHPGWTNLQISLHGLTWKQLYMGTSPQQAVALQYTF